MVWWWGEGKTCFKVPAQALLGGTSCWDDMPPERGKAELEPIGACHKGERERNTTAAGRNAAAG